MRRREFHVTAEAFLLLLGVRDPMALLDVEVDHRRGTVKLLADDPGRSPLPEGNIPVPEPLPVQSA